MVHGAKVAYDLNFTPTGLGFSTFSSIITAIAAKSCGNIFYNFSIRAARSRASVVYYLSDYRVATVTGLGSQKLEGPFWSSILVITTQTTSRSTVANEYTSSRIERSFSGLRVARSLMWTRRKSPWSGKTGYVWVFTNLEEITYVYSDTREATTVHEALEVSRVFSISDFYAAYDSIECIQQKCLIHL